LTDAILQRDYVVIQIVVLMVATGFVLINLTVDLLYGSWTLASGSSEGAWWTRSDGGLRSCTRPPSVAM
jgi:hypothetical protein